MKDKILKKLGIKGLIIISLFFVVGVACLFAFDMQIGLGTFLVSAGALPLMLGTASITDSMAQTRTLKYTHSAALNSGDVIVVGGLVLIAINDTLADTENIFAYITKATMVKKAPLVISLGDIVYWDATPGEITKTNTDVMCGYCIKAAGSADTTVDIFLFPDLTNIGTAEIADGAVTSAKLAETTIQYATVNLTVSQIKGMAAAPVTLVAAPGANKVVEFVSALLKLEAGSEVLSENADNMAIRYTDGAGVIVSQAIETTGFIDQAADTVTNVLPKIDAVVALSGAANKALVLDNTGNEEFAGNVSDDAALVAKIAYRVHDLA